ncbi:uncharacterized protein BDZ83DRAFT_616115 [Colletotrichum acutatum]|uniref:Uncharacterized protein n=1 Tax=Glomerella acutata TaxID=27357 RepID=A0AAD8XHH9_GLOAC|nr:uncharacterized protein BDZ83DRAFT_616115 [Colletotrichum acutatum]KAK1726511.1 hypothetical protein BDZ83DRAFT_616115 [Colletotrichum acutatum]
MSRYFVEPTWFRRLPPTPFIPRPGPVSAPTGSPFVDPSPYGGFCGVRARVGEMGMETWRRVGDRGGRQEEPEEVGEVAQTHMNHLMAEQTVSKSTSSIGIDSVKRRRMTPSK